MLMFSHRIVWIEGSLNITRAGYLENRELVTFHASTRRQLPHGTRQLVNHLANQGIRAARIILKASGARLRSDALNRSVTSLDSALLSDLIGRTKAASDIYIVSPFFDRRDQAGPSIEVTALRTLAKQYPKARFRIFLPDVANADGAPILQGSKGLFTQVFGPRPTLDRVGFCGVPSSARRLHAKLVAIRHRKRGAKATLLTGSPNFTAIALLRRGAQANVELARELTVRWPELQLLTRPLGRKFRTLANCVFELPQEVSSTDWHVLKSAIYCPFRGELTLEWRQPGHAAQTELLYAGTSLTISAEGLVENFGIRENELRLETVSRTTPSRRSFFPIVIPYESRLALGEMPEQGPISPEWWLAQLGALSPTRTTGGPPKGPSGDGASEKTIDFPLGMRVRELAERMRYAIGVVADRDKQRLPQVSAHLDLLAKIFEVHDPSVSLDQTERAWRIWVRLEIFQAISSTSQGGEAGRKRLMKAAMASELSKTKVPQELRRQCQILTDSLA